MPSKYIELSHTIYDGLVTAWGYKSMPNSRLLVAEYGLFEEDLNEWMPFCSYCIPEFFVWDDEQKKLIELPSAWSER